MLARDALKHKEKTFEPLQGGKYYSLLVVGFIKVIRKVLPSPHTQSHPFFCPNFILIIGYS